MVNIFRIGLKSALTLFFLIFFFYAESQTFEIDEYNQMKAIEHNKKNFDSLYYYANKMLESKNYCRVLTGKNYIANNKYFEKNYEEAEILLNDLIIDINNNQNNNGGFYFSEYLVAQDYETCINIVANNVYRRLYYLNFRLGDVNKAYENLMLRSTLIESIERKDLYYQRQKLDILKNRGNLKLRFGEHLEAKKIFQEALSLLESSNISKEDTWYDNYIKEVLILKFRIVESDINLGKTKNVKYFDSALINNNYLLNYTRENNRFKSMLELPFEAFVNIYINKKTPDSLKIYIDSLNYYFPKRKDQSVYYRYMSEYYNILNIPDSVIINAKKCLNKSLYPKKNSNRYLSEIYPLLAVNYYKTKKNDSAYKYSQLTLKLNDSLIKNKNKAIINFTNDEIKDIKKINESIESKRSEAERKYYLSLVSFVFALMIFFTLYFINQRKTREKYKSLHSKFIDITKDKPIKKDHYVDDELTNNILNGLKNIELTNLFLQDDFSLINLARILNTNTKTLSHVINKYKDDTFKNYILKLKMNYIINELKTNPEYMKYSLEALGKLIGYKNGSSFTRAFKNYKGITPSEFIKQL